MNWVYDVETLINMFCVTFYNRTRKIKKVFVIVDAPCATYSDLSKLQEFIRDEAYGLIGFNSVAFDRPVMEKVMSIGHIFTPMAEVGIIYDFAQKLIADEKPHYQRKMTAAERDLYLIHHFNNDARRTSLKWLQCHLGIANIQDMPIPHDVGVKTMEDIQKVIDYNWNDVLTTDELYHHNKTQELMKVRKSMAERYRDDRFYNMSNSSMGEAMFRIALFGGAPVPNPPEVKTIIVKDIISDKISFKTKEFQKIFNNFKKLEINPIASSKYDDYVIFDGMQYHFGLGGLHAARESTNYFEQIDSIDVRSFYPNLAILFELKPSHLGADFNRVYKGMYDHRASLPKGPENAAWKESLTSVFGKSNSIYSFLYDPSFTFSITINGQLLLAMLCEDITLSGAGRVVMANTDGIEVYAYDQPLLRKCINDWMALTGFVLESNIYNRLAIRDCNNYIALDINGNFKTKGAYELDKEFHKDPSGRAVSKAVMNWLLNDADDMALLNFLKTLPLSDFFMYARAKTGKFVGFNKQGRRFDVPKTIRYISSKSGFTLCRLSDKKYEKIHADTSVFFVNNLADEDFSEQDVKSNINYTWYLKEVKKLIIRKDETLRLF